MKDKLINDYWVEYLRYWKQNPGAGEKYPTEDGFWRWFADVHIEVESDD